MILEPLHPRHARLMYRSLREPAMYRWIPVKRPESVEALEAAFRARLRGVSPDGKSRYFNWALRLRGQSAYAGRVEATLRRNGTTNLAYILFKRHRGKGLAFEATARMIEFMFARRDCVQVEAGMDEPNRASWRLAEALGLRRVKAKRGDRLYELRKSELAARGLELRTEDKFEASRTVLAWHARLNPGNAAAAYQCAWAHDLLGLENMAIPFYERAVLYCSPFRFAAA